MFSKICNRLLLVCVACDPLCFFSLQEYLRLRSKAVSQWKEKDENPYPHKFHVGLSLTEFIQLYNDVPQGEIKTDLSVTVAGASNEVILTRVKKW